MTEKYLLAHGFVKSDPGYEFLIHQYGGYHDFVYYEPPAKRLCIQYKLNNIDLQNCDKKKANEALHLVGLPDIDKLQKE